MLINNFNSRREKVFELYEIVLNSRLLKFCVVGGSGVVVNMGVLYLLTEYFRIPYYIASLIAIELSILSNFFLNHIWTWKDRVGSLWVKLLRYHVGVAGTAFLFNYILLIILTGWLGIYYLLSNLIGITAGTILNYLVNDRWTFKTSISTLSNEHLM